MISRTGSNPVDDVLFSIFFVISVKKKKKVRRERERSEERFFSDNNFGKELGPYTRRPPKPPQNNQQERVKVFQINILTKSEVTFP